MNIESLKSIPKDTQAKIATKLQYSLGKEYFNLLELLKKVSDNPLLLAVLAIKSPDLGVSTPYGFVQFDLNDNRHILDFYELVEPDWTEPIDHNAEPLYKSIMDKSKAASTFFEILKRNDILAIYDVEEGEAYIEVLRSAKAFQELFEELKGGNSVHQPAGYLIDEITSDYLFIEDQYFVDNISGAKGIVSADSRLPKALAEDMTFYDTQEEREADYPEKVYHHRVKANAPVDANLKEKVGTGMPFEYTPEQMQAGLERLMAAIGRKPVFTHNRNNRTV